MNLIKYTAAQNVLNFYIEKLEYDETMESKWCLQWINLQMAKFKCENTLDMLCSYPIGIEEVSV